MTEKPIRVLLSGTDPLSGKRPGGLGGARFSVRCASGLGEVLESLAAESADVVLLDLRVPANKGLGGVGEVHEQFPEVPVVVLAGPHQTLLGTRAVAQGAQDYLIQDEVTAPLLERVLRYAVERQALVAQLLNNGAYDDPLTGLPNRKLFLDRLRQAQAHARRHAQLAAVLFLDLDAFKAINDTLGHGVGDQLLRAVAKRLSACVRETDTVARLGGDEFTVVLRDLDTRRDAAIAARKILHAIARPFSVDGHSLHVTASLGISLYPPDGPDDEALVRKADMAMYRAKRAGKNTYRFFDGLTEPASPRDQPYAASCSAVLPAR